MSGTFVSKHQCNYTCLYLHIVGSVFSKKKQKKKQSFRVTTNQEYVSGTANTYKHINYSNAKWVTRHVSHWLSSRFAKNGRVTGLWELKTLVGHHSHGGIKYFLIKKGPNLDNGRVNKNLRSPGLKQILNVAIWKQ